MKPPSVSAAPAWTKTAILLLLLLPVLLALFWANLNFARLSPGGSDFLVHWVGTRAFFLDGLSPYSDTVALRIQTAFYGRPALPGEHELRVAYPIFSTLVFLPFALVGDYTLARALWLLCLEAGLVLLTLTSLRLVGWRPPPLLLGLLLLFSLAWYHAVRPLVNGNAVVLVALLFNLGLLALRSRRDPLAALLFALSAFKPQLTLLPLLWVALWAVSLRRWRLALGLPLALALLCAAFLPFLPAWPQQFLGEVLRYPGYNPPGTPGSALQAIFPASGRYLGYALTAVFILLLLAAWRKSWRTAPLSPRFLWTASLTLLLGQLLGIQTDPGNFIMFCLPLVWVLDALRRRWPARAGLLVSALLLTLAVGLWWLFLSTVDPAGQHQQHPLMFFPLPAFLLAGLYLFPPTDEPPPPAAPAAFS
jgi:hypothetical protein